MLEAVIVCVDYSDFLAWTLPFNRHQFDHTVVVTTTKDIRTQKLCEYWHVKCVKTDVGLEDGGFNKGKFINAGIEACKGTEWMVHLDADICLPPHFRRIWGQKDLDLEALYTMDRLMCKSFDEWIKFLCAPPVQYENGIFIHNRPFPVGVRLCHYKYNYLPIGYFQLWHQGVKQLSYPTEHTSAARGDVQFTLKFGDNHRHLMGEFFCIHLETKKPNDDTMGQNWWGRTTPLFGADFIEETNVTTTVSNDSKNIE